MPDWRWRNVIAENSWKLENDRENIDLRELTRLVNILWTTRIRYSTLPPLAALVAGSESSRIRSCDGITAIGKRANHLIHPS